MCLIINNLKERMKKLDYKKLKNKKKVRKKDIEKNDRLFCWAKRKY